MFNALINKINERQRIRSEVFSPEMLQLLDEATTRTLECVRSKGSDKAKLKVQLIDFCSEIEKLLPGECAIGQVEARKRIQNIKHIIEM